MIIKSSGKKKKILMQVQHVKPAPYVLLNNNRPHLVMKLPAQSVVQLCLSIWGTMYESENS